MNSPARKPPTDIDLPPQLVGDEPTLVEQRWYRRHGVQAEVIFAGQHDFFTHPGVTRDISQGGVFLATEHVMPVGERLALTFTIRGFQQPLAAIAEVRWVRERPSTDGRWPAGMGLQFLELPRSTRESLAGALGGPRSVDR